MEFWIEIKSGWKTLKFKVVLLANDAHFERYQIIGRNKSIELISDRPFWRGKGLKHRRPKWSGIRGGIIWQTAG